MKKFLTITALMYGCLLTEATAQNRDSLRRARIDSALTARYFKTPYDTNYVVRPDGKLTFKVKVNQSGDAFHIKGHKEGVHSKANLNTSRKTTISIGASYRGVSAALAINPGKIKGIYDDYELNLSYFSSRLNLDASYHRATTLAGDIERGNNLERLEAGDVKLKVVNLAGYYVFNHRRFSYPAAFTQSYIQRRSAGSWLAGISYQGGSIESRDELKARNAEAPDIYIHIGHLGIGGGYGYNWIVGKRWLFHITVMPSVVVYNHNYMILNDERRTASHMRVNMLFNERAAVVYNFSPRYFAGITGIAYNSLFKDNIVTVNQNKWRANAFFGVRF